MGKLWKKNIDFSLVKDLKTSVTVKCKISATKQEILKTDSMIDENMMSQFSRAVIELNHMRQR